MTLPDMPPYIVGDLDDVPPIPPVPPDVAAWVASHGHTIAEGSAEDLGWCIRRTCANCPAAFVVPKLPRADGQHRPNGWGAACSEACPIDWDRPAREARQARQEHAAESGSG